MSYMSPCGKLNKNNKKAEKFFGGQKQRNEMRKKHIVLLCSTCFLLLSTAGCSLQFSPGTGSMEVTEVPDSSKLQSDPYPPDYAQGQNTKEKSTLLLTEPEQNESFCFVDAWGEWFETMIDPNLKQHTYDWNCLERNGDEITYEKDPRYVIKKGIDVSHHQGKIDWEKVRADGYEFAFIRIAYRGYGEEGSLNPDREYETNLTNAKAAGMQTGVYVFSQAVSELEAIEEAQFVLHHLKNYSIDLPIVYDPEQIRDQKARTDHVTREQFTKNAVAFCKEVKAAGYQPMIYSNMYWEAFLLDFKQLQEYSVWYADYEIIPQTPYAFEFLQYSESGCVDGIEGPEIGRASCRERV